MKIIIKQYFVYIALRSLNMSRCSLGDKCTYKLGECIKTSITIRKLKGTYCGYLQIKLEPLKNTSFSGNIFYEDNREIVQTGTQSLYYLGEGSETSQNFTIPSAVIYQAISYGK